jgi:hypothetical protein
MSYDAFRRLTALAAAVILWAALGLQLHLALAPHAAGAAAVLQTARHLLSTSFAILTTLLAALSLTLALVGPAGMPWANVMSALAVALTVVAGLHQAAPGPLPVALLPRLAGIALYDAAPGLFVIYWLLFVPKGRAPWIAPLVWLVYPAAWMGWAFYRGAGQAPLHAAGTLVVFLSAGIAFYALDRLFRPLDAP